MREGGGETDDDRDEEVDDGFVEDEGGIELLVEKVVEILVELDELVE